MKNKMKILIYAVNAFILILIVACVLRTNYYSNVLLSQQTAKYWAGDSEERFAAVSCFFPLNNTIDIDAIYTFRKSIDSKLTEAGVEPREDGENWTDCYSATSTLMVEGDRNSSESTAIGVGGDFFMFHPYQLISGSYIYDDDLMKDRVVLDYELAWKLFGGTSLDGMQVTIDGTPYFVAGVVRRETDKFSQKAFTGEPAIFMSYSALSTLKEGTSISCYELTISDPISNFAKTFVEESFEDNNGVVVENSSRYDFKSIFDIFKEFGSRSMATNGVIYPYWENSARISEVYIARLYVIIALLALFPFICMIVLAVRFIKFLTAKLKLLKFKLWDAWDDRFAREAVRKERREQKRRSKILERHFRQQKQNKRALVNKSEEQDALCEEELVLDIEHIVREIMDEMEGSK